MKKLMLIASLTLLASISVRAQEAEAASYKCDPGLFKYTYNWQKRLTVIKSCITMKGMVNKWSHEKDGDVHIQVRLDEQFKKYLNHFNYSEQNGNMVVELICVTKPELGPAIVDCGSFRQRIPIPEVNTRISFTGALVLDRRVKIRGEWTHGWREIHPVTSIRKLK
jgi:hypothetical protein